jgi:hypothetical protein
VDRAHVEAYARDPERAGRARSTVARRLAALAGVLPLRRRGGGTPPLPVAHVRRPSVARDSQALGLDREEAARFLAAAKASSARDHTLACLLMLNGLRVSEACAVDVADLGIERATGACGGRQGPRSGDAAAPGPQNRSRDRCPAGRAQRRAAAAVRGRPPAGTATRRPESCAGSPAGPAWASRSVRKPAPHDGDVGPGCRRAASRRPGRCPARRSADDPLLRPGAGIRWTATPPTSWRRSLPRWRHPPEVTTCHDWPPGASRLERHGTQDAAAMADHRLHLARPP